MPLSMCRIYSFSVWPDERAFARHPRTDRLGVIIEVAERVGVNGCRISLLSSLRR